MIVEEKVSATAINREVIEENPNRIPIKYPIKEVNNICPMPVIKEIFPTSFITLGDKCNPTINNRKDIPISEKTFSVLLSWIKLRKKGPTNIPDKIYPIISGCLKSLIIIETTKTINIISPNCINGLSIFLFDFSHILKRIVIYKFIEKVKKFISFPNVARIKDYAMFPEGKIRV